MNSETAAKNQSPDGRIACEAYYENVGEWVLFRPKSVLPLDTVFLRVPSPCGA